MALSIATQALSNIAFGTKVASGNIWICTFFVVRFTFALAVAGIGLGGLPEFFSATFGFALAFDFGFGTGVVGVGVVGVVGVVVLVVVDIVFPISA